MTQIADAANLTVIGAGSWGTVLAQLLAQNGHRVKLWTRTKTHADILQEDRENKYYMPGLKLEPMISISSDIAEACENSDALIWAIPSHATRLVMAEPLEPRAIISCAKGIEGGSFKTMTEVLAESWPETRFAVLSGPNLASEIAQGKPAAATLGSYDPAFAINAQRWFNQASFRVYRSSDQKGLEIAGAVKNIIALAAGMSDGLALGDNAKASLITRGLAELVRLGKELGGKTETFYGLAGLGDLIATCSGRGSRNHRAGELFAKGKTLGEIQQLQITAEGIPTVKAVYEYSQMAGLELPISSEVFKVVYQNKAPHEAISNLMRREAKDE